MATDSPRPETARPTSTTGAWPHRWTRVEAPEQPGVVAAYPTVIAGAGPAGLTAAYELTRNGHPCVVLEADPNLVGGISRTDQYKGYRFDIGGHRFFSKNAEVNRIWHDILGDELISRPRLSRIYYDRKFFHYPLRPWDALRKLGPLKAAACVASYLKARLRPIRPERSVEDWVVNRFGRKLFTIFFKTYTEKVWGMPTAEISADWAAQRIKGLSLTRAVLNAVLRAPKSRGEVVKTLIDRFEYPRLGPGQMWEAARDRVQAHGGAVHMDRRVVRVEHDGSTVHAFVTADAQGRETRYHGRHFLSTMPLRHLIRAMSPAAPPAVAEAAAALRYRDFLTVVLIVNGERIFPDTWIYIHEPSVRLGRVQNFRNWSPAMCPEPGKSSLGLEYFCFAGDDLWTMPDDQLIDLGRREIDAIGLVSARDVLDGCVVRMPKAYPVYDDAYQTHLRTIRGWLDSLGNLEVAGRNGMHKYNNQDHSMITAVLAARNILGAGPFDPWKVNTDAEYHEDGPDDDAQNQNQNQPQTGRAVPRRIAAG